MGATRLLLLGALLAASGCSVESEAYELVGERSYRAHYAAFPRNIKCVTEAIRAGRNIITQQNAAEVGLSKEGCLSPIIY
ncbi:hypothetical protein KCP78_19665 [Salmonella enterica subsp. enterica]|nr:hypothetical protein KCP78_19665 [Salmonella enterica subsp. enterica]